jgi:DNA (cytosine-5)-methyltransferase 1
MTSLKRTKPTFVELFAGVGGFRLGLEKSGWEHAWSNQWEPATRLQHASSCYVGNFGQHGHSNQDIAEVTKRLKNGEAIIPKADLLVGGFPCQDYSVAKSLGSAKGIQGKKGVLWWEILEIVSSRKPKVILLENVDRLLSSPSGQKGRDFAIMLRTLSDQGFFIEWRVINSADYGFPQRRKRVFVFAHKKSLTKFNSEPSKTILSKAFPISGFETLSKFEINSEAEWLTNYFGLNSKKSSFQNWGIFDGQNVHTAKVFPQSEEQSSLRDILVPTEEVPEEFWVNPDEIKQWEFLKGSKALERTTADGFIYKYSEGQMAFPDDLERPSRTILTGEGGRTPSRFKHVVKVQGRLRRLTPVELERLNGFPDDWTKFHQDGTEISDARRAFFMGNALVIGLVERAGKVIRKEFFEPGA